VEEGDTAKSGGIDMSDRVYKLIEIIGTSAAGVEDAVQSAIARAAKTIRHMRWFEVVEIRGSVDTDRVAQWQVTLKVGFTLEEDDTADD
jgi:flavin-binding protein dodecin